MADLFNEELGRRIRAARGNRFTQAALGERIGLSRTAVTNIECGRQRLLVDQLVDIAEVLGVTTAELLPPSRMRGDGEPPVGVTDMPTVERWISSVKQAAPRSRR